MNKTELKKMSEDEVLAHINTLEEETKAAKEAQATAEEAILELNEKLAAQESTSSEEAVVSFEKEKYKVLAGKIRVPAELVKAVGSEVITKGQLAKHPEVVKHLVATGSGILVKVEPTEK